MFLKLDPVVEQTSFLIKDSNCLGISFLYFSIWHRKLKNLSISTNFRCFVLEIGSIKLWCVCNGRSNIMQNAVFQEFSNIMASLENKSERAIPVHHSLLTDFSWYIVSLKKKKIRKIMNRLIYFDVKANYVDLSSLVESRK